VRICERNSVLVWIQNVLAFVLALRFCVGLMHCSQDSQVWILVNFSLKLGFTALFTYLKIILLPYF